MNAKLTFRTKTISLIAGTALALIVGGSASSAHTLADNGWQKSGTTQTILADNGWQKSAPATTTLASGTSADNGWQ